jgi:Ca2+-binding RTX toxin-like protein
VDADLHATGNPPTGTWFIHTGSGDDAISVNSGTNVLDGGAGSNFLVGGTGNDTFFVDDRAARIDIWSTLVNFNVGDAATMWGVSPNFAINWQDNQGTAGSTGLTLHATTPGMPTAVWPIGSAGRR